MNYEEKIHELESRVEYLEKKEKSRQNKKIAKIVFKLTEIIVVIVLLYLGYNYVNEKYIKPYNEAIKKVNNITEKYEEIENKASKWLS